MTTELLISLAASAFFVGVAKAGFSGISFLSVFLLVEAFGAKESLGVALPLLIAGDLVVYPAFRKYGSWKPVWKLLWPTIIGGAIALWVLTEISNETMRVLIGCVILSMVVLQIVRKTSAKNFDKFAHSRTFGISAGIFGGIATLLANAAGPVLQMYLMSCNVKKMDLIGIGARFFLIVNFLKIPLNSQLGLLTWKVLLWDLAMLPALVLGVVLGKKFLQKVSQQTFEWMVVAFALVAGMKLVVW